MDDDTQTPPAPEPTGLMHQVLGLRAAAAVAVATLVLGGLGGAALGAVSNGVDEEQGPGGQFQPGQGLVPGGRPPGTAPQDDVQPDVPA